MAVQYSNVGNPISQALGGLTQYLMIENERLDQEQKEQKIDLASQRIAERYQNLPPDATIADIQKLQYQLIEDAASLGGLQENLPLISSLFQSTVSTREMQKVEKRDAALQQYIADKYGVQGDFGGEIAMGLTQLGRQMERNFDVTLEDGTSKHRVFDANGKMIFETDLNQAGFATEWAWKKKAMDYAYQQDINKISFQHKLTNPTETAPSFPGMDMITTVKGVGGETLYKHHKNGGTYYLDGTTGKLKQYWGDFKKVTSAGEMKTIDDALGNLKKNADVFQPQRLGMIQSLQNTDFLKKLTGGQTLPVDEEKQVTLGAVGLVDTFLQDPNAITKLQELYEDMNDEEYQRTSEIMERYKQSLTNEQYFEKLIQSNLPNSAYDSPGLITDTDWENASVVLNKVFNKQVPEQYIAPIMDIIAKTAGVNINSASEQTFRTLTRRQQEDIMRRMLPTITQLNKVK